MIAGGSDRVTAISSNIDEAVDGSVDASSPSAEVLSHEKSGELTEHPNDPSVSVLSEPKEADVVEGNLAIGAAAAGEVT
jgi:hypothetical protein